MHHSDRTEAGYLFAGLTILIWSGFIIVSRLGGKSSLSPFDITALRVGTAAVLLSPWWLPRLLRPHLRKLAWYQSVLFALIAGLAYPMLAYGGFAHAPASHGAVLISGLLPFFTTVFTFLLIRERPSPLRLLGLCLIAVGVGILIMVSRRTDPAHTGSSVLLGDLMFVTASCLWALFTALLKRWDVRAFDVTLGVVATGALLYLPIYVIFIPKHLSEATHAQIALQAFFQGFVVVCCAMWTYAKAAELLGAGRLAILMSSVPAIGSLLAIPFLGESLGTSAAIGVGITSLGAFIGALARNPQPAVQSG